VVAGDMAGKFSPYEVCSFVRKERISIVSLYDYIFAKVFSTSAF
jgi:hypothetical protein